MQKIKNTTLHVMPMILILAVLVTFVIFGTACNDSAALDEKITNNMNPKLDYLILVNDDHPYQFGSDYDKALKQSLVYVPDVYGESTPVEKATYTAFLELQKHLADQGMSIGLFSAYRTKADQQYVYDYYGNLEGWAETNKVAKPGYSEHHTGLLLNVLIWYQGEEDETPIWYTETAERQEEIEFFKLLHENLADYGFIDRYPSGKESVTGCPSEPYEIRFVGSAEVAHAIMDGDLTLEEYLEQN